MGLPGLSERLHDQPVETSAQPMERIERILLLHRLFASHRFGLTAERLMEEGQCSRATLYRDLEFLRDNLGAPVEHDGKQPRTWRYTPEASAGFQLPGVWLSADELYALLLAQQMLQRSGAGLLGEAMSRFQARIERMLGEDARQLGRLRVLRLQARPVPDAVFRVVAEAVLKRRQLRFGYGARSTGAQSRRQVSPLRLTHHRDNWYLDAWDEQAQALRCFAVERIQAPDLLIERAREVPLTSATAGAGESDGYGIFAGPVRGLAVLRFTPMRRAGWRTSNGMWTRNWAGCRMAAWNSPCPSVIRANC